jgi:hypothetical protein
VRPPGDNLDRTIDSLHRYAAAFLKELRPFRRPARLTPALRSTPGNLARPRPWALGAGS